MITREELIERIAETDAVVNECRAYEYNNGGGSVYYIVDAVIDALISSLPEIKNTYLNDREPKALEITGDTAAANYRKLLRMKK